MRRRRHTPIRISNEIVCFLWPFLTSCVLTAAYSGRTGKTCVWASSATNVTVRQKREREVKWRPFRVRLACLGVAFVVDNHGRIVKKQNLHPTLIYTLPRRVKCYGCAGTHEIRKDNKGREEHRLCNATMVEIPEPTAIEIPKPRYHRRPSPKILDTKPLAFGRSPILFVATVK